MHPPSRYIFMTWSNGLFGGAGASVSGSPPVGWARFDRSTGEAQQWVAPLGCFCEEPVMIPKSSGEQVGLYRCMDIMYIYR